MLYQKIDPIEYPLKDKESWWIVHPNSKGGEFIVPDSACTACLQDIFDFKKGTIYRVFPAQREGYVCVSSSSYMLEMPQYLFGRHFDAEIFVRGTPTQNEIETVLSPFTANQSKGRYQDHKTGKWVD